MEVVYLPGIPAGPGMDQQTAIMEDEMDIDINIDVDQIDESPTSQSTYDQRILANTEIRKDGATICEASELTSDNVTPHKIHLRGLDDLSTSDIASFLAEHVPSDSHTRIEWIDDTSANVVFPTPAVALKALEQLTSETHCDVSCLNLQLRAAKPYSARPELSLQIRPAVITDQKRPRAYEASRFYMMHPDLDPRERSRREKAHGGSIYRKRRYGQDEQRRRRRNDQENGFNASMYDDDAGLAVSPPERPQHRRLSSSLASDDCLERSSNPRDRRSKRRVEFSGPGARERSASPDMELDDTTQDPTDRRARRRTPPRNRAKNRNEFAAQNSGKELFPSKPAIGTALSQNATQEHVPNKLQAAKLKKELFPGKSHPVHHRRSDAFDAADATADLFAHRLGFTKQLTAGETAQESSYGRLRVEPATDAATDTELADDGLNIRGASQKDTGFTIRGTAADGTRIGVIKELFPDKAGSNSGKELFAEKLQGRGGRRNRAVDMFH